MLCSFLLLAQVRMCRRDREIWERVEAANTLAYLTEVSTELQRTAAMTDHLIHIMNDYLKDTPTAGASAPQGISVSPIVSFCICFSCLSFKA